MRWLPWSVLLLSACVTTTAHQHVLEERDAARAELTKLKSARVTAEQALAQLGQGWELVPVVVAAVDIAENTVLTPEMVAQRDYPKRFVTSSLVKPDSAAYVLNQKVLVPLQAGDALLWSMFEAARATDRISTRVGPGQRLISLTVSKEESVSGLIRPEDHVDVVGVFKDKTGEFVATTVAENVVVAATGDITARTNINLLPESERRYTTVSLLVSGEEAERIALARELSTLSLTLRNPEDRSKLGAHPKATQQQLHDKKSATK